ncbi:MAG: septal ring lytic transglycosylase RlpA family protein [Candidatus Abawacabacteria bacterium]|nr:septal ring lytic transglycosylase RlpA family protein [Candidatus Abawacabacteria bacterium]
MSSVLHPRIKKTRKRKQLMYGLPLIAFFIVIGAWYLNWRNSTLITAEAKEYTLTIDGANYALLCSDDTVGVCLRKENIIVYEQDYLWPEMTTSLESGMHVIIRHAVPVQLINVLGEESKVFSRGTTVGDVLNEQEIVLTDQQRVIPEVSAWLEPEIKIQILAEREEKLKRKVDIAFKKVEKRDATLTIGKRIVEQEGLLGKKEETYNLVYIGDQLKEKKLLRTEILSEPQDEIVKVGTKMPAQTETIENGKASFYSASLDGSRTASGPPIRLTEMVAAHKTLPFGSLVKVTNVNNGKSVVVKIIDRGPYITGRVIDLTPAAFQQIASLSSGVVSVRLDLIVE